MFFHILKRDLKRKKTMNTILLLFIIMASMFLAGSVSNLKTVLGAVDEFMEISKVPDFFALAASGDAKYRGQARDIRGNKDEIEEYLGQSQKVKEYQVTDMYNLANDDIRIIECAADPDNIQYERTNVLSLTPVPDNFMKVFDQSGKPLSLEAGEIAIPRVEAESNKLQAGDELEIMLGGVSKIFRIKTIAKDAVFASSMMGFKRFYISREDFAAFAGQEGVYCTRIYSVTADDLDGFQEEFRRQNFNVITTIDKPLVRMCYVFDMLFSGILIIVSVCLILIAFLILRFTIVFTLQEDYKEIGIMKAIGIQNRGIRGLYLIKYLAISVTGALIGLACSYPFQKFLMNQVVANFVVPEKSRSVFVNVLCAVFIVVVVLLFCYMSTGRLNKFTAMEAIRSGSDGERFSGKNAMTLSGRKHMKVSFYMACNDVLSNKKRYFLLGFIFCIGTLLILLPLSAINTLKSREVMKSFSMLPSTAFIDNGKTDKYNVAADDSVLLEDIHRMEDTLKENGINGRVWAETGYTIPCYSNNPEEVYSYFTMQALGNDDGGYQIVEGRCPELKNEIMVTELTAREMQVGIGDSIYYKLPEGTREYVVTGLYQSLVNMGKGARMNVLEEMDYRFFSGILSIQVLVLDDMGEKEAFEAVKNAFPEYGVTNPQGYTNDMTGGILTQMDALQALIVGLVLVMNSLITVLMMKTLIGREHGEIAMLKSMGFRNGSIRAWQIYRILLVLTFAILLGILLSAVLSRIAIRPIFAMMGATSMELVINPVENYVLYPMLLLFVTGFSATFCGAEIRRVDLKEINDLG